MVLLARAQVDFVQEATTGQWGVGREVTFRGGASADIGCRGALRVFGAYPAPFGLRPRCSVLNDLSRQGIVKNLHLAVLPVSTEYDLVFL